MSAIYPVSRERHGLRAWNKATDFSRARHERIVAVGWQEALQLMMTLPLAFARQGDQWLLVVMLGLHQGDNLMVGLDGKWLGPRIPGVLQHYPFRLLRDSNGRDILGVDEAGLLPEGIAGGTPMFDNNGAPVAELSAILGQLAQNDQDRRRAREVAGLLYQRGVIRPWELKISNEEGIQKIDGLFRIDEPKLNELAAEALAELRDAGALLTAYAQILSTHHVHQLGQLAVARYQAMQRNAAVMPSNLINDDGIISFDNL